MRYSKAVVALLGVLASWLVAHVGSGGTTTGGVPLGTTEWSNVVFAGLTSGAVFTAANVPSAPVTKSAIAALSAVFVAINNVITDVGNTTAWWQVVVALVVAILVYAVRNGSATGPGVANG